MPDTFPKPGAHHKRIREKYNPVMNADEKRHRDRVQLLPCYGCERLASEYARHAAHHTLLEFEGKRWRRDHRRLLPLCGDCHRELHGNGNEAKWLASVEKTPEQAEAYMRRLWEESQEACK